MKIRPIMRGKPSKVQKWKKLKNRSPPITINPVLSLFPSQFFQIPNSTGAAQSSAATVQQHRSPWRGWLPLPHGCSQGNAWICELVVHCGVVHTAGQTRAVPLTLYSSIPQEYCSSTEHCCKSVWAGRWCWFSNSSSRLPPPDTLGKHCCCFVLLLHRITLDCIFGA